MKVGSIGYNYKHGKGFEENRPNGIGCYLLLLVRSEAYFEIAGKEFEVTAPSYVLISADAPCRYGSKTCNYCDDWIYLVFDEQDVKWVTELGVKINECVPIGNIEEFSGLSMSMAYEHFISDAYNELMETRYLEQLFILLARRTKAGRGYVENARDKSVKLNKLRVEIYNKPGDFHSIDDAVNLTGMSRSTLQHSYKEMFGISLAQDIINARLNYCARLLMSTSRSLYEIAIDSGYQNEFYFMRQFKEHYHMTPTEYRVKNRLSPI